MDRDREAPAFVGFYWTLPLPRFGFTRLPESAEEAAARSRTIRYQRERVRRYVGDKKGRLMGEVVWLEISPDRGSAYVKEAFDKAMDLCRTHKAMLVYVAFDHVHGSRRHMHLLHLLEDAWELCRPLAPKPVLIDGKSFDPIKHFRRVRRVMEDLRMSAEQKWSLQCKVRNAVACYLSPPLAQPNYISAADLLNQQGIRTVTGREWTADNLRMFLNREIELAS